MKSTGIVRRIDELGRIVIPKEIRKTLRLREGEPLEIFTAANGEVILKKYSPMCGLNEFYEEYAETLSDALGCGVIVTDLDTIISVSKLPKKDYMERDISKELDSVIRKREAKVFEKKDLIPVCKYDDMDYELQIIRPIISASGDCIGSVILVSKKPQGLSHFDESILKIAASFLGKAVK